MLASLVVAVLLSTPPAAPPPALAPLAELLPSLTGLYEDLHRNPELGLQEERTAAALAGRLRALGFEVTTGVGGHGVVGVLRNGPGPVLLLRTDMDALPILEETGLPYASTTKGKGPGGEPLPVMHACGHDVHMASWVGAATLLARARRGWGGTLLMVAQPAEELLTGATAMLADGLHARFGKPDFAIGLHVDEARAAGTVGLTPGFATTNADLLDLVVHGRGGHGAYPHLTVDPVLIAARIVVALQGIVAREVKPGETAVVTVGSIQGGSRGNVIPDEVRLQLTVRSYKDQVHAQLLAAIERIAKAEAQAGGAPREPTITRVGAHAHSIYNEPALAPRLRTVLERALGTDQVVDVPPDLGSEDFSAYGRAGARAFFLWLGATSPEVLAEAQAKGTEPPSVHTSRFAPDVAPTIRTGATALTLAALELLSRP